MSGDLVMPGDEPTPDAEQATVSNEFDDTVYDSTAVRPYAVTGGRTRPTGAPIPLEALLTVFGMPATPLSAEKARIVELALTQYLSIAELSAHLHLPVGVVRVLVGDLVDEGHARVDGTLTGQTDPAATLSILESVLDGISAL